MAAYQITSVSENFGLGECPNWLPKSQSILQVDAFDGNVFRVNPETKESKKFHLGTTVTFVLPCASDPENKVIVSDNREVMICNLETNEKQIVDDVEADITDVLTRFNDGKCDAKGRLWAGTMAIERVPTVVEPNRGSLYKYCPQQSDKFVKMQSGVTLSNGLEWSLDNSTFFYVDSVARIIDAFDFNLETGELSNRRNVVNFNTSPGFQDFGVPDGMCLDQNDTLWVACYDGWHVLNIDPRTGSLLRKIKFPVSKITSCCFGGPDYSDMYVTSASFGLSDEGKAEQKVAGSTFKVTGLGVKGRPSNLFQDL